MTVTGGEIAEKSRRFRIRISATEYVNLTLVNWSTAKEDARALQVEWSAAIIPFRSSGG